MDEASDRRCEDQPDGPWVAPEYESSAARQRREHEAKVICSRCPSEIVCLAKALQQHDRSPSVVRGGLTGAERGDIIELVDAATTRSDRG